MAAEHAVHDAAPAAENVPVAHGEQPETVAVLEVEVQEAALGVPANPATHESVADHEPADAIDHAANE